MHQMGSRYRLTQHPAYSSMASKFEAMLWLAQNLHSYHSKIRR
jgi:hypothetical protein